MSISTGSLRHTIPTTKLFIVRTYDNEESERILLPQVFPAEYRKLRLIILIISIEGKQYQLFRMWSALMTLGHVFWLIGNLEMDLSEGKYARKSPIVDVGPHIKITGMDVQLYGDPNFTAMEVNF
ncbi:unnamed protein product [Albugo candida]|uniref:Uncharacterized protein n=1 Tax=Albugo candida TaxID=65357 RepID=A0A024FVV1_9STRA|nr:unnamed protein product [Albugo candida]|eukprot:CCI11002.1 unnamed protein product [Albugo candida]